MFQFWNNKPYCVLAMLLNTIFRHQISLKRRKTCLSSSYFKYGLLDFLHLSYAHKAYSIPLHFCKALLDAIATQVSDRSTPRLSLALAMSGRARFWNSAARHSRHADCVHFVHALSFNSCRLARHSHSRPDYKHRLLSTWRFIQPNTWSTTYLGSRCGVRLPAVVRCHSMDFSQDIPKQIKSIKKRRPRGRRFYFSASQLEGLRH